MAVQDSDLLRTNMLLAALPEEDLDAFARLAELRSAEVRDQVYEIGEPIDQVLFPIDAVYSLVSVMSDGRSVEVATVGREAFAQVAGEMAQVPVPEFRRLAAERPRLRTMLHRYTLALLAQIAQSSACNRLHTLEQRCARWLLMTHDRVGRDDFDLTQDFLSQMLGVRRAGVGAAHQALSTAGLISYVRGTVTVLDRPALERRTCECYALIRAEHDRLASFDPWGSEA